MGRERKDRLFNFRPIFFMAVFLCAGIAFCYSYIFYQVSLWWLALLFGLATPFVFCGKSKLLKTAAAVFLLLVIFFLGMNCFGAQVSKYQNAAVYKGNHTVCGVLEKKLLGERYSSLILTDIQVDDNKEDYKLIAYLPTAYCEEVQLFDKVILYGNIQTNESKLTGGVFSGHMFREGIKYTMPDAESCVVIGQEFKFFGGIRARIENVLYQGMDRDAASVTIAVLTGNTSGIEKGLLNNIRYGGIAHIFAVSGLHVGALYAFCMLLTSKTGLKKVPKFVRFGLVAGVLLFYGGICGYSSSVLRATVLCLVGYAAKLIGVSVDKFETIGLAAILVLLLSPAELFGPGFQLSFLACLGIFLWKKPLEKWGNHICDEVEKCTYALILKGKNRTTVLGAKTGLAKSKQSQNGKLKEEKLITLWGQVRNWLISFLSVSTATQIATAPVLLQTFGYLSGWSMLLNFFFIPFISAVFSVLLVFAAAACIFPLSVAPILLYVPNVVWSAVLLLFEAFDFSGFAIQNITLSIGAFICYYGGFSFLTDKWNLTEKEKKCYGALLAFGFVFVVAVLNI